MHCLYPPHHSPIRENKKSAGKKEEKKRKSAGGDKDKDRGGGNDSFKSREFIETSEESSSDSDHKSKSKRKKVGPLVRCDYQTAKSRSVEQHCNMGDILFYRPVTMSSTCLLLPV